MDPKIGERKSSHEAQTEELETVKTSDTNGHHDISEKDQNGQDVYQENGVYHKVCLGILN